MIRQLHGQDSAFLHLDSPNAHMGVTIVYIYDQSGTPNGKIRFKDILNHIDSRVAHSPMFRSKLQRVMLDLDNPYWVDDKHFDVEFHVRHVALPKPGDWRQLCIQIARFHSRPLDLSRPLWEMCVIEGLDNIEGIPKGGFAIATKVHHSLIDGHSAIELTWNLHDLKPEGDARPRASEKNKGTQKAPGLINKMSRILINNISEPMRLVTPVTRALPKFATVTAKHFWQQLSGDKNRLPQTRFNKKISCHRVWECATFDFLEFKNIKKNYTGATVNDVVLAVVAGAMRHYLMAKDELPAEALRALAPINVRKQEETNTAGNQISLFFPDLPTHISDPVERLEVVVKTAASSKEMAFAIGAREMSDVNKHAPPVTIALAGKLAMATGISKSLISNIAHTVVTNVPGPQQPFYLLGAKLVKLTGLGTITDGIGLFHAITSYDGQLNIAITACRDIMSDPEFYVECINKSYEELKSAVAEASEHKDNNRATAG